VVAHKETQAMKIICIGDVHGRTDSYQKMLRQRFRETRTVQIGDMGIGFPGSGLHKLLDYRVIDMYVAIKPDYVLSHEAPSKAAAVLLHDLSGEYFATKGSCQHSRTAQALQAMLDIHQPKEWVFGHYHVSHSFCVPFYDTKFTCVSELDTHELNTGEHRG
jgi:hypothetical protein